jgi:tetratricopeptide (TPR) repeat protein
MTWNTFGRLSGVIICAVCVLSTISCGPKTTESGPAEIAYELRMSGKLGEARQVLEDELVENPDYAMGHYELSRLKFHMMLGGNRRNFERTLTEVQESIDRAVELDSSNVSYVFYAGLVGCMRSFVAMNLGEPTTSEEVTRAGAAFETALRLKPDYREAMLYLVELYGVFPADAGGDISKAEAYMSELATADEIYGLKARSILEDVSVADWRALYERHPDNTDVLEELGKAYLREGDATEAVKCFDEAVAIDSSAVILFLDLGRHHFGWGMEIMRSGDEENEEAVQTHLADAEAAMLRYLETDHPAPMKAYALRMLSNVKQGMGDEEERTRLKEEAKAVDPHHSRATGRPSSALFTPPGMIVHDHKYLTRPY